MNRVLLVGVLCLLVVAGVFAQTLPAPTNLAATQVNEGAISVKLTWDASVNNVGFRVYRSAIDTAHFQPIGMANSRTFYDRMVVIGTRYYYFVKSVAGNSESERSNVVDILVVTPPPPTPPPTPTNLVATLVPDGWSAKVKLTWYGPRGSWNFRVSRSANDTSHYNNAGTTPDTSFLDHSVQPGTTYYYFVKAFSQQGGESGRSNVVDILVVAAPRPRGTIRGTVIDDSTNAPIRNVSISFFRSSGPNSGGAPPVFTDSLGRYTALLDTGRYIIRANAMFNWGTTGGPYRPEYYDNCPEPSCATVVAVAESSSFTANFGLSRPTPPSYVYVSGTVTDTNNVPLRHARVSVVRTIQEMNFLGSLGMVPGIGPEAMNLEGLGHTRGVVWNGYTDSLGNYRARVIANQRYIALASKEMHLPEYYNNKRTIETADIILVEHDTTGINFSLEPRPTPNNSISGSVKDSAGAGVPSRILLLPARHNHPHPSVVRYGHTDSLGNYSLAGLPAGQYFVMALPFSNYGSSFYKLNSCGVFRIQDADTVVVGGNITGIDICVRGVHNNGLTVIRGAVRSANTSVIAGVRIAAFDAQGEFLGIGITDAAGVYELNAIAPGVVTIVADYDGYASSQLPVTVNMNVFTLDNVNITLSPSTPTSVSAPGTVPEKFVLGQNYPNPFNPNTTISYAVSASSIVTLKVFNVLGQEVATLINGNVAEGSYNIIWNGKDNLGRQVSTGVYIYKMHATAGTTEFSQMKKMVMLK